MMTRPPLADMHAPDARLKEPWDQESPHHHMGFHFHILYTS